MKDAPLDCVSSGWKRYVVPSDQAPDRRYYTLYVLARLFVALRRRDIYVPQSSRWGDPRAKLLQGEAWERVRTTVCQSLGCSPTAVSEPETLTTHLDDAYRRTAANLPSDFIRIEVEGSVRTETTPWRRVRVLLSFTQKKCEREAQTHELFLLCCIHSPKASEENRTWLCNLLLLSMSACLQ